MVGQAGLRLARRARAAVQRAVSSRPVYGRTTGVGANRSIRVTGGGHGLRLLRSHAGGAGPMLSAALARAMLAVRLNQLAACGSGVDPALLPVLAEALNLGLVPPVRAVGAIGTGDLGALALGRPLHPGRSAPGWAGRCRRSGSIPRTPWPS